MRKKVLAGAGIGVSIMATMILSGCAAPAPKDFGGKWRPVNQFETAPTAIPINHPYVFFASPLDETLKTMLARWAKDSGMSLAYQLPDDYTLYTPVSRIHTADVQAATAQLSSIYAAEGVSVSAQGREILVQPASASSAGATAAPNTKETSAPKPGGGRGMR